MIPRHSQRNLPIAPDQLFNAGFRDGLNGHPLHPQFQSNIDYLKGYAEGCVVFQTSTEFVNFGPMPSLDSALQSLQLWEKDRKQFGFGKVALSFRNNHWLVLVSKDLHDAALPF